ncbi:unnamed protein product [Sphagnum compactum]
MATRIAYGNHMDRRFRTPVVFLLAAVSDNANKSIISSSFLEVASFGLALKERRLTDLFFSPSSQIGN